MDNLWTGLGPWGALLLSGVLEGLAVPWPSPLVLAWAGAGAAGPLHYLGLSAMYAGGYVAGALVQYGLARLFGPALLGLLPGPRAQQVLDLLARWGQPAVLWSRPLVIGNFVSIPAAVVRMPLGRFALYTWLGIWPWSLAVLAGGG